MYYNLLLYSYRCVYLPHSYLFICLWFVHYSIHPYIYTSIKPTTYSFILFVSWNSYYLGTSVSALYIFDKLDKQPMSLISNILTTCSFLKKLKRSKNWQGTTNASGDQPDLYGVKYPTFRVIASFPHDGHRHCLRNDAGEYRVTLNCSENFTFYTVYILFKQKQNLRLAPTNSIVQGLFWDADSYSVGQEIPRLSWSPKIHYRVQNSPWLDLLTEINPVHSLTQYLPLQLSA
jgi:hypothetical protein